MVKQRWLELSKAAALRMRLPKWTKAKLFIVQILKWAAALICSQIDGDAGSYMMKNRKLRHLRRAVTDEIIRRECKYS